MSHSMIDELDYDVDLLNDLFDPDLSPMKYSKNHQDADFKSECMEHSHHDHQILDSDYSYDGHNKQGPVVDLDELIEEIGGLERNTLKEKPGSAQVSKNVKTGLRHAKLLQGKGAKPQRNKGLDYFQPIVRKKQQL